MQLILGADAPRQVDEAELATLYPWPSSQSWLRAMMLQTLDGSALGPDGRSKSISSSADMQIFRETRRLADAVLIGAQTMRAERYRPMKARDGHAPVLVIVSASLELPWEEPVWRESAHRPVVITRAGGDGAALAVAREHAEVEVLSSTDASSIVEALHARGLHRITCEGGPRLLAELVRAGLVDELDVAIAPLMVGGGQIHTGEPHVPVQFALTHVLESDGYLFTRCLRGERVAPTIVQ
jgi:riboflavin biosynthesis pyrimidine reductase